ncbi:MAG: transketolase-like TK C-terminal-containing protein, partial [Acidimicrobiales bacterium]
PSYLPRLREFGGLQAYPSRTKDPDPVDFSTGSVGLGAAAPLFAAATRRYIDAHFGARPTNRFIALIGDAELDEGNVWEAIADPATQGLGNVMWVVDLNRQSLDRVVPGIKATRLQKTFADNGWHVVEAKYGRLLRAAFERPGGEALRRHIDDMPNEAYQALFGLDGAALRGAFLAGADAAVKRAIDDVDDAALAPLLQNLGGHDLGELITAYRAADASRDRPSIVFAYTVKGWGLPIAGDPLNHSALLTPVQIGEFRDSVGLNSSDEWDQFPGGSAEAALCEQVGARLAPIPVDTSPSPAIPVSVGKLSARPTSSQAAFGRLLLALARTDGVGERLVSTSPDVAVSTNLGGWINKAGVFSPEEQTDYLGDDRLLRWRQAPSGQHIELGISEMNLFLLLGQLGLGAELHGEQLLPIGTLYDPFVARGLDAFIYAVYSGARFVVVGTPSGVTLSPEGGAHQSTITASIGLELPGCTFAEPAYAGALDWLLCDGLRSVADPAGEAMYLRLSTRPLDQTPFATAMQRHGEDRLREAVLAGGYELSPAPVGTGPAMRLCGSGAVIPEVLAAAEMLAEEGIQAQVIDITSLDRLYREWQRSLRSQVRGSAAAQSHVATLLGGEHARAPIVTVHDAASHSMAWLGSVWGSVVVPLGVDEFGQSGTVQDLYRVNDIDADSIVNAAIVAVEQAL